MARQSDAAARDLRFRSTQAKKSSGGSKKRKSEAISEEEPAAEAAGGDDAMDMTAVNKLTADKLKKELKKRKLDATSCV